MKTAFTSGCFDLMHPGHIKFIKEIRSKLPIETKLIVALHGDEAIRDKKGAPRPLLSSTERKLMLENIKGVDEVIVWEGWETVIELVFDLDPDYLVTTNDKLKENDWENSWQKVSKKIGAELIGVEKHGDYSTTEYLNKINEVS